MNSPVAELLKDDAVESDKLTDDDTLLEKADEEEDGEPDLELDDEDDDAEIDLTDDDTLAKGAVAVPAVEEEDTEDDSDEEDSDVEASLDELLLTRVHGGKGTDAELDEEEEDDLLVILAPGEQEGPRPRGADEFLCGACFLVKHRRQLVDTTRSTCVDCVDL